MSPSKTRTARRQEIVFAAWHLVAEFGIDAVRIQDIAEKVGTSTGTIHYYFRDKDDVLAAALEYSAKRFAARKASQLPRAGSQIDRILALVDAQVPSTATWNEWAVWIELWAEATRQDRFKTLNEEVYIGWKGMIRDLVIAGQDSKEFSAEVDAAGFATDFIAMMDGLGIQTLLNGPGNSTEYMRSRLTRFARRELLPPEKENSLAS